MSLAAKRNRTCYTHRLQTNRWHREEETQNTDSNNTMISKATSSLFLSKMIAELERKPRTTPHNKGPTLNPKHKGGQQ